MSTTTNQKDAAIDFLQLTAAGRVDEAFARHAAPSFRHHNPYFAADAAAIQAGMRANAASFPQMSFEVQRALADGPLVAVHSRARMAPGMPAIAVVHILRFEEGKIAEMWDIGQAEPVPMANQDGMF
jgi:predicted SnoaL-like aldol condensation-catalyzing enzyme